MIRDVRACVVTLLLLPLLACGTDDDDGGADAGSPGAGGGGGQGSGAGGGGGRGGEAGGSGAGGVPDQQCFGISGTYDVTRTRSLSRPGSCPPGQEFNPSLPISIVADQDEPSGYRVKVGYTTPDGEYSFEECVNNVSECSVFATCEPSSARDEVELEIAGNSVTGTLARTDFDDDCTINFDLEGARQ